MLKLQELTVFNQIAFEFNKNHERSWKGSNDVGLRLLLRSKVVDVQMPISVFV